MKKKIMKDILYFKNFFLKLELDASALKSIMDNTDCPAFTELLDEYEENLAEFFDKSCVFKVKQSSILYEQLLKINKYEKTRKKR